jgi:hypothetical protein
MIEDVGKKLKLSNNIDITKLVWRNYTVNFDEDSIDIEDIMNRKNNDFDGVGMSCYLIS